MDRALSYQEGRRRHRRNHCNRRLCLPSLKFRSFNDPNPFSPLGFWVPKLVRSLYGRARMSNGSCSTRLHFTGMVVNNALYCASPYFLEAQMEGRLERIERMEENKDGFGENGAEIEAFVDEIEEEGIESSSSSGATAIEEQSHSSFGDSSSPPSMRWPVHKIEVPHCSSSDVSQEAKKPSLDGRKLEKQRASMSEIEMVKERFSKLLLGEDMSGSGNGVCTALAISNAITNLCATIFGQLWRLEPLPSEKKLMWHREMAWLLCVSDHMVELTPSWQTFPDGRKLEVMTCRPRSDLYINLPALRKLDNMLLEILDSFENTEFGYVDQGILAPDADGFQRPLPRQEEKWWLPLPCVPPRGLSDNSTKNLQHKRDCTNQILKAAMAINSITLTEMEVPLSYFDSLPKNGRASVGDFIYRHLTSDQFSPECLLDCLDLSSEHLALEIANRVEAAIYSWRRKTNSKPVTNRSNSKSSWEMVKELVIDLDKRELLAEKAESLLLCLKQRCPGLPQTALDMSKIQYNKDVGKSILESYSRVLESLASNIAARIDDLLYVDDLTKRSNQFSPISKASVVTHQSVAVPYSVSVSSTPCRISFTTPSFSSSQLIGHMKVERSPFIDSNQLPHCGFSVKRVLTDYLDIDTEQKDHGNSDSFSSTTLEVSDSQTGEESFECLTDANLLAQNSVGRECA